MRRDAVIRFNEQFQVRQERLGRLRAYKNLHDILHKIHSYQAQITKSVAGVVRPPAADDPDPQSVIDALDGWLIKAREHIAATKLSKRPRWFERFEAATLVVTSGLGGKPDAAELARATLVLGVELDAPGCRGRPSCCATCRPRFR